VYVEDGVLDLDRLALSPGQASGFDLEVSLRELSLGGRDYEPGGRGAEARLDVSRTSSGYALRLRFQIELTGPCVRCLETARLELAVDAREVDQPSAGDEELRSPYVSDGRLDVARWANDAMLLGLPAQPLCREECAGLCPVCGESLNDADPEQHHHGGSGDPRMAKLRDLRLE
jgi:DUF177 domain-containing protein